MKKIIITATLICSLVGLSSGVSAQSIVDSNSNIASSITQSVVRDLKFIEPSTSDESLQTQNLIYSQTPFIKDATPGKGESEVGIFAVTLPYYFSADFDSNLTSTTMTNGSSTTVRITSLLTWEDWNASQNLPNEFNYYDITLYANGASKGTYRFTPNGWHHADWTVPAGANMYFYMSKHVNTWTGAQYFITNGDLSGSGTVLNQ